MWIFKEYSVLSQKQHQEILAIRNEQKIKEASKNSNTITLQEHLAWVKNRKSNYHFFALIVDGVIVGGVNYIANGNNVLSWGIFFSHTTQPLIASLATYIFIEYMLSRYGVLLSEVLKSNTQALKFNIYFGIEVIGENEKTYFLQLTKEQWQNHKKTLRGLQKRVDTIKYCFDEGNR